MDKINYSGYFDIEVIDNNGKVTDKYEDKNLIMETSRSVLSKLFIGKGNGINRIVFGTLGHQGELNIVKKSTDGFVSTRDRIFSEFKELNDGTYAIIKNDIIKYVPNGKFYQMISVSGTMIINSTNIANTAVWKEVSEPYNYYIDFTLPTEDLTDTNVWTENNGSYTASCTVTDEKGIADGEIISVESTVQIEIVDGTVKFTVIMSANVAQGITQTYRIFTEAGLYSNNDIFSMKVFPVKYKNNTSTVKVQWGISF